MYAMHAGLMTGAPCASSTAAPGGASGGSTAGANLDNRPLEQLQARGS